MKIFWSWQSDTPGKIGRFLIRDALAQAIDQLKTAPDIEEPTAEESREAIHLDHDVQGTTGSPDIARTILGKIDATHVFVADATLVGSVRQEGGVNGEQAGKKLMNSNVAIELSYALRALTDANVIMVLNAHYGGHEELPFDLRHKGGSVVFDLSPNADKKQIEEARKKLKDRFVVALRPYLETLSVPSREFEETPTTSSKAAYFQKGESLAQVGTPGRDGLTYSYGNDTLCYLRLIPTAPRAKPLPLATLANVVGRVPLLKKGSGVISAQNDYGMIGFEPASYPSSGAANLRASTQLFQNGEIWSLTDSLIITERGNRPTWLQLPALVCLQFEQAYYDTLRALIHFGSDELALGPHWRIELGLTGVKGLYLYGLNSGVYARTPHGPFRGLEVVHRMILHDQKDANLDAILSEFFSLVYDSAGYARPTNLFGFPPTRPSG